MTHLKSCTTLPTVINGNNFLSSSLMMDWLLLLTLRLFTTDQCQNVSHISENVRVSWSVASVSSCCWSLLLMLWLRRINWYLGLDKRKSTLLRMTLTLLPLMTIINYWTLGQWLQRLWRLMWFSQCCDDDWGPRMRNKHLTDIVNSLSGSKLQSWAVKGRKIGRMINATLLCAGIVKIDNYRR